MNYLFLLSLFLFLIACQPPPTPHTEDEPPPVIETLEKLCLDTNAIKSRNTTLRFENNIWYIQNIKKAIPLENIRNITWYYSKDCSKEIIQCDSLILAGPQFNQTVIPFEYYDSSEDMIKRPKVNFEDVNFDGHLDFRIYNAQTQGNNRLYSIYLYEPKVAQYVYSELLSQMTNFRVDPESKTIHTFYEDPGSSRIFVSVSYEYQNGQLIEIQRRQQAYDASLKAYVLDLIELQDGRPTLIARDTLN